MRERLLRLIDPKKMVRCWAFSLPHTSYPWSIFLFNPVWLPLVYTQHKNLITKWSLSGLLLFILCSPFKLRTTAASIRPWKDYSQLFFIWIGMRGLLCGVYLEGWWCPFLLGFFWGACARLEGRWAFGFISAPLWTSSFWRKQICFVGFLLHLVMVCLRWNLFTELC